MNKNLEFVKAWLVSPGSVTQRELESNLESAARAVRGNVEYDVNTYVYAYGASAAAAAHSYCAAKHWVDKA